jgi:hypothetical protein
LITRLLAALACAVLLVATGSVGQSRALALDLSACTPTDLNRDSHFLTAKVINTDLLNQDVEAVNGITGEPCDIGAYYNTGAHTIVNSHVHGAIYFGIAARGAVQLDVSDSSSFEIGDKPTHSGAQHGVGIAYIEGADGSVTRTEVYSYQKNGFAADGAGTVVNIADSRFRGAGAVDYIAQNGVQFSRGAVGSVTASTMEEHEYTGCSQQQSQQTGCTPFVSAGLLIFDSPAKSIDRKNNLYRENDFNVLNIQSPGP